MNNDILCIIYTPFIRSNFQTNVVAIYMVCPQPIFLPNTFYFICNELVSVLWIINIFRYIFILCFIDNYSKYGKNSYFYKYLFHNTYISGSFHSFLFDAALALLGHHSCDACNQLKGDNSSFSCRVLFIWGRIWIMFVNTLAVDVN